MSKRKIIDEYWENGKRTTIYQTGFNDYQTEEVEMSEYEYKYGEPDPDDTGEHYTEWMPRLDAKNDNW